MKNPLRDVQNLNNLKNTNSGPFMRGVIEDNNDPDKLGRVKVRIFGIHPDDETVTTSMLPWAEVMGSTTLGLSSGIGISSIPLNGTYVWVFFDLNWNKPIVVGSILGFNSTKDTGTFSDKDGVYPLEDRLQESDINRLSRNEKFSDTKLQIKENNRERGISTSTGKVWDEPSELNTSSTYPNNTVMESASGHIIEIDDTSGNERVHVFHKSGSYVEIRPDGTIVMKSVNDKYEVNDGNTFQNNKKNTNVTTNGDSDKKIVGYEDVFIGSTKNEVVTESSTRNVGDDDDLVVGASKNTVVTSEHNMTSGGATNIVASIINLN